MRDETRETLELFVEKATKLVRSRFIAFVNTQSQITINYENMNNEGQFSIDHSEPDSEAIEAFVLTFRFFIQNNESISLANLERILDDPGVSDNWKQEVTRTRSELNGVLDSTKLVSGVPLTINGQALTNRELMQVFVFGHLAHANKQKHALYRTWASTPFFPLLEFCFYAVLKDVVRAINWIGYLSQQELVPPEKPAEGEPASGAEAQGPATE